MNVYDKANELARELRDCSEVVAYRNATDKIDSNPANKKMVDDFRKKQIELYTLQMQGKQPSKDQMDALNSLYSVISLNSDVKQFLEAEMTISKMYQDIMKLITDAIGVNIQG